MCTDRDGAGEEFLDLLRLRACGDIDIAGLLAEEHIADTTASKERLVPGRPQGAHQPDRGGFHRLPQGGPDAMHVVVILEGL